MEPCTHPAGKMVFFDSKEDDDPSVVACMVCDMAADLTPEEEEMLRGFVKNFSVVDGRVEIRSILAKRGGVMKWPEHWEETVAKTKAMVGKDTKDNELGIDPVGGV